MPNIPQYDLPLDQSRLIPEDRGAGSMERAAGTEQRVGRVQQETSINLGNMEAAKWRGLGQMVAGGGKLVDDVVTQHNIASAAEEHTKLAAQAAKDLPGILASSDNPVEALQNYYDKVYAPAAENINSGMMTKRSRMWAVEHSQAGAQAFMRSGIAEAITLQGAKAISSFENSVGNLADAARANPHDYEGYLKQVDSMIDGMKGTLSPAQQVQMEMHRNKVKESVAIAAAHSLADQNPEQFTADLAAGWGKGNISESTRSALEHYANFAAHEKKLKAARTSGGIVADWGAGGTNLPPGQSGVWTPQGIGWLQNNPNVRPEDKPEVAEFGRIGLQIEQIRKQFPATGRRAAPHGNLGDEFDLEQKINRGEAKISDLTDAMKQYMATKGQHGINNQTAARLMAKMHPDKIETFAKIHRDPNLQTALQQAEEFMQAESARILKGLSIPEARGYMNDKGHMVPSQLVPGDFSGVAGNPAYKSKVRDFRNYVNHTLEDAAKRGEDWRQYLDPKNDKYLFGRDTISRFLPSTPELQSGVTFPPYPGPTMFGNANPNAKAPRKPLDEIMGGIGGPKRSK